MYVVVNSFNISGVGNVDRDYKAQPCAERSDVWRFEKLG